MSPGDETRVSNEDTESNEASTSSFSFIAASATSDSNDITNDQVEVPPGETSVVATGASVPDFLSSPNPEIGPPSIVNTPQEIKLGKVASTSKAVSTLTFVDIP